MKPLQGRTAIITGASRGIGRAIALQLASDGARCVLSARDGVALKEAVVAIEAAGGRAASLPLDLRLPHAGNELADFAVSEFGNIAIVVNNAGATRRAEFLDLTEHDWSDGFALKFFGAVRLSRAAWPHLKASSGSVVNISGIGGRTPGSAFAVGGSVNAALLSFTKALAETGTRDGIQVNAINPGAVRTDRFQARLQRAATEWGVDLQTAENRIVAEENTVRIGEPEDIAGLVSYIVGPRGRFLQGAMIDMDGGATKSL